MIEIQYKIITYKKDVLTDTTPQMFNDSFLTRNKTNQNISKDTFQNII